MRKLLLLLLWVLCLAGIQAQVKTVTIIKAGKLIDTENGKVLDNQLILVENDTIKAVGPNITIPKNATIIDLSKATVLPGLIDCHTHVTGQPGGDYYADIFRKTVPKSCHPD